MVTEDRPAEMDLGAEARQPVEDPEKQQDLRIPDELAAWAISLVHHFREEVHRDTRSRAKTGFGYYNGEQWDPAMASQMKADHRPCLTFNEIRPKIDAVIGEERRNREDWIAKPREGSDSHEADVRTALLKYVREINNLHVDESRAFEDVVAGGFGGLLASLIPNPDGGAPLLRSEYRRWHEFSWDWNSMARDWSDAQWMAVATMVSVDRLQELFPQFGDLLASEWTSLAHDPLLVGEDIGERIGVTRYADGLMRPTLFDPAANRIQAIEFYYRVSRKVRTAIIQTPTGPVEREIPDGNRVIQDAVTAMVDRGIAQIVERREQAIRGLLIAGRRVLAEWWSPFRGKNAFGVPLFPIFLCLCSDTDGYIMGLVEPMIGPQDEINKRWSMVVENYLRQARSGGVYEDGAFENETDLKTKWGAPGAWVKAKMGAIIGKKFIEHGPKPTDQALMTLFTLAEQTMERVSNIEKARLGQQSNETSGVAIRARALQSALVQVKAFDNFRFMQLQLGRFMNSNLQLMFPVRQAMRLTMPNGENRSVTLNDRQMVQGIQRIVNSTESETFDIVMDLTPGNATFREMQAQNLANLLGQIGPPMKEVPQFLPAYMMLLGGLIRMLDGLPNREEIVRVLDAAAQQIVAQSGPAPMAPPELLGGQVPGGPVGAAGPPGPTGPPGAGGMPFLPAGMLAPRPGAASSPGLMTAGPPPGAGGR